MVGRRRAEPEEEARRPVALRALSCGARTLGSIHDDASNSAAKARASRRIERGDRRRRRRVRPATPPAASAPRPRPRRRRRSGSTGSTARPSRGRGPRRGRRPGPATARSTRGLPSASGTPSFSSVDARPTAGRRPPARSDQPRSGRDRVPHRHAALARLSPRRRSRRPAPARRGRRRLRPCPSADDDRGGVRRGVSRERMRRAGHGSAPARRSTRTTGSATERRFVQGSAVVGVGAGDPGDVAPGQQRVPAREGRRRGREAAEQRVARVQAVEPGGPRSRPQPASRHWLSPFSELHPPRPGQRPSPSSGGPARGLSGVGREGRRRRRRARRPARRPGRPRSGRPGPEGPSPRTCPAVVEISVPTITRTPS